MMALEHLYFADAIPLEDLCSVIVFVPCSKNVGIRKAHSQPEVIKCREFIFTEQEIIATPLLNQNGKFQMIMQRGLFKTGRLQNRFLKMGLQSEKPRQVTPAEFQSCLRYTLVARMAPAWNKVGEYLVQGRDFVTSSERINAITLEFNVTVDQLIFALQGHVIKMAPVKLNELDICSSVMQEFYFNSPMSDIEEYSIQNKWCHILPSMKKGQVVRVTHKLPGDCPFNSYKDIKRHWKNSHGYRLPDDEDGVLYYQVYFKPIGNILFTYPDFCIRKRGIIALPRVNPLPIVHMFLADLRIKLGNICGKPLELYSQKAKFTENQLLELDEMENESFPNLADTCAGPRYDYRKDPPSIPSFKSKAASASLPAKPSSKASNDTSQECGTKIPKFGPTVTDGSQPQCMARKNSSGVSKGIGPKIVPCFKRKVPNFSQMNTHKVLNSASNSKSVPTFKPIVSATNQMSSKKICNGEVVKPHMNLSGQRVTGIPNTPQPKLASTAPSFVSEMPHSFYKTPTPIYGQTATRPNQSAFSRQLFAASETSDAKSGPSQLQRGSTWTSGNVQSQSHMMTPDRNTPWETMHGSQSHSSLPPTPSGKRKPTAGENYFGTPKKPRAKPKIQENVDMEVLAMTDQLSKVNTATLLAWLKSNNVPCKSKEKKSELMDKVRIYLNLPIPPSQIDG